jgi:hypothetical protein
VAKSVVLSEEWGKKLEETYSTVQRLIRSQSEPHEPTIPRSADGYIARTPVGGIPGRQGCKIFGELCDIFKLVYDTDGSRIITPVLGEDDAPYQLYCFNLSIAATNGLQCWLTDLMKGGHRYLSLPLPKTGSFGQNGRTLEDDFRALGWDGIDPWEYWNPYWQGYQTTTTTESPAPGSTTTTMPAPACDGRCKWVWSASSLS